MLDDCFVQGILVGIQILKHMIKCINDFYEYVKIVRKEKRGNDDGLYIQNTLYHCLRWPCRAENGVV